MLSKISEDKLFVHFQNVSNFWGFAPDPLSAPGPNWETSVPRPLICPPLEKFCKRPCVMQQFLNTYAMCISVGEWVCVNTEQLLIRNRCSLLIGMFYGEAGKWLGFGYIWHLPLHLESNCYHATACDATHGIAKTFLSVGQTRALWQNERNFCPHSYATWKNDYPTFPTWKMVGGPGGGRPLAPEILVQTNPVRAKTPIFNRYSLIAPQP